jgi:glycosyltransferase involved in cell wall biosynthesis
MKQLPKKVLFLITKATWGGAQKYVFDLATHLPKEQFDVSVAYGMPGRLLTMLQEKNISTHAIPSLGRDVALFSDIVSFFQLIPLLRVLRPDVLHVNSSKAAALGALAARVCGIRRIIFTAHGWPFKENRNTIPRIFIFFISWFSALLSHATIVVSKTDEEIGKRMWLVGKKIHYVPLGIEPPQFLPREEAARILGIETNVPRIVTIGELTKNKGHRYAIDAVRQLKDSNIPCAYFIIGHGELREELEEYAIQKEVETRIFFCDFVENASRLLKAFDIFLLPSLKEGTPYVLLEAESSGLPIVATNAVDESFADRGLVTFVPAANASLLAEAIERAVEQPANVTVRQVARLDTMVKQTARQY